MRRITIFLTSLVLATALTAQAAHTAVQLFLSADSARPGDKIWAGVDLKMDAGWHTYWKNPGESGIATTIKWDLPSGVTAGEIQWPLPEKLPPAEVTTYGYEDEVMLLVPLTLATNLAPGALDLKANVAWLECQDACVPGNTTVETKLNIANENKASANAAAITSWQEKVPKSLAVNTNWQVHVMWESTTTNNIRPFVIDMTYTGPIAGKLPNKFDLFPDASDDFEIESGSDVVQNAKTLFSFRKTLKKFSGDWPKEISGVLVAADSNFGIEFKLPIGDKFATSEPAIVATRNIANNAAAASTQPAESLWQMLLFAFIGGLILNIMPCVLPVIALKILGFVNEAKSAPRRVRALGLVYALGVIVSLMVLAAIIISVKASGLIPTWGMQFGSPIFIVCLTTLVTLVALNLFGVFEVVLGGRVSDTAGELASRHGASGAFFNGVLATTLATPCTAPFLAPALGFAFAQTNGVIALFFLVIGLGLASPYVLLSWHPAWLKFLPKPGAWMEKFKIAMGFPMLATVMWLLYIASSSYGRDIAWLGGFLVVVALAAWIFGEFVQRGRHQKTIATIIALLLLVGGYIFILEKAMHWRAPYVATSTTGSLKESADGIDWQPWSPAAVAQARAAGKIVLVDFTADWCTICQVNKKTSIEIPSVRQKLHDLNAIALVGDNTLAPQNIAKELQRYQRAGVPLVLVYPKNSDAEPIVLPATLTPDIVLNALDQAAK